MSLTHTAECRDVMDIPDPKRSEVITLVMMMSNFNRSAGRSQEELQEFADALVMTCDALPKSTFYDLAVFIR